MKQKRSSFEPKRSSIYGFIRISVLIESHQKATELGTKVILKDISKSVLKVIMMAKLEQILNLG